MMVVDTNSYIDLMKDCMLFCKEIQNNDTVPAEIKKRAQERMKLNAMRTAMEKQFATPEDREIWKNVDVPDRKNVEIPKSLLRDTVVYLQYIQACTDGDPKALAGSLLSSYRVFLKEKLEKAASDQELTELLTELEKLIHEEQTDLL